MRKAILTVTLGLCSLPIMAQKAQQAFRGYLYNNEYDVYLDIDFHHESITVPGNELYGQLPGYLGKKPNSYVAVEINIEKYFNIIEEAIKSYNFL